MMDTALTWYQTSALASAVGSSVTITAVLSALHALGFTFIMGGALFANLGLLGVLFPTRPVREVAIPGSRLIALGLAISLPTGLLLFGPRAVAAAHNTTFQLKMLLIVAASAVQFALQRNALRRAGDRPEPLRALGGTGLVLWVGLALTACAFILFE
jgi:hypothetical protein